MNKKITGLLLAVSIGISAQVFAQDETDALRYSRTTPGGTARAQAIGGAMGSLGGDYSAAHVNPAGLGFFRTNEFVITPGFYFVNSSGTYRGTTTPDESRSGMQLPNLGVVFGMPSSNNSAWKNFSLSLGYNRLANFNNKQYIKGNNNEHSLTERWLEDLAFNNIPYDQAGSVYPLGSSLAFNTFLVDTALSNGNPNGYKSRVNPRTGILQQDRLEEKGGIDEFAIGFAGNYLNRLYLGGSINISTLHYESHREYAEDDISGNNSNEFDFFELITDRKTDGLGVNVKLGAIYAATDNIRIGAAFHTPTWYNMKDISSSSLLVNTENFVSPVTGKNENYQTTSDITDGYPVEFEYSYRTPLKALGSFSYIFGTNPDVKKQHGFITADVEYVDYASSKYKFKGEFAQNGRDLNTSISNLYKSAVNVRVGGELKLTTFAIRGGFAYYGDPYKSSSVDASIKKISGGVGYRNRGFFADLTYIHTLANDEYYPYFLAQNDGMPVKPATIDRSGGMVVATVGFKF
jgi:hypothetical protein